ncbi:MAG TPA: hypothetical protein VNA25_09405 [Phycisphaerae bacterium]|nr:hypothetical protein [Phycisphaerae bacterium]
MSNKIDTVMDNIVTQLGELVEADGTGVFKAVQRAVINALTAVNLPIFACAVDRLQCDQGTWTAHALLQIAANKGGSAADSTVTDLIAEADAQIRALAGSGAAGGGIDQIIWDPWYRPGNNPAHLDHVGAIGSLRIRVEGTLKTS